jgi:hypothetical protein
MTHTFGGLCHPHQTTSTSLYVCLLKTINRGETTGNSVTGHEVKEGSAVFSLSFLGEKGEKGRTATHISTTRLGPKHVFLDLVVYSWKFGWG